MNEILTTIELADKLKMSRAWVLRKVHEGAIPFTKIGRPYRFNLDEVMDALNKAERFQQEC